MKTWIKICGITDAAAMDAALRARADAVGFVFANSVREVTPRAARELARRADGQMVRVAVMRHPTNARLQSVLDEFSPDVLQTDAEDFAALDLPPGVEVLPVYRDGAPPDAARLARRDWLLYEGKQSGSGGRADWTVAADLARGSGRLVLAGGLTPDNVGDALAKVSPWGVDVSSGVEAQSGRKDPNKIAAFVAAVRNYRSMTHAGD